MGFLGLFKIPGAIKEVAGVARGVLDIFDEFFHTDEEKAKAKEKLIGGMSNITWLSQVIRSWRRANLAAWVVKPFIVAFWVNLPIMVFKPEIGQAVLAYMKMYVPLLLTVLGPYFGYYGIEKAVEAFKGRK